MSNKNSPPSETEVSPPTAQAPIPADGVATGGSQIEQLLGAMMGQLEKMNTRQEAFDQQLASMMASPLLAAHAGPLVTAATVSGQTTPAPVPQSPETARYEAAGLNPPPTGSAMPKLTPQQAEALVAFIPKDDPMNPRQITFETWINGNAYRARRGQVMMLPRGHAIMLASSDLGYVVDVELMSGITIPTRPDLARPDNWNGLPLAEQSSVPAQFYRAA